MIYRKLNLDYQTNMMMITHFHLYRNPQKFIKIMNKYSKKLMKIRIS